MNTAPKVALGNARPLAIDSRRWTIRQPVLCIPPSLDLLGIGVLGSPPLDTGCVVISETLHRQNSSHLEVIEVRADQATFWIRRHCRDASHAANFAGDSSACVAPVRANSGGSAQPDRAMSPRHLDDDPPAVVRGSEGPRSAPERAPVSRDGCTV